MIQAAAPSLTTRGVVRRALWVTGVAAAMAALTVLTLSVESEPYPSQDLSVIEAIQGWDAPGLRGFFEFVSYLANDNWPAMLIGATGVLFLWLLGQTKAAVAFLVVGAVVAVVAFLGDYTLGAIVDRTRPLIDGEANPNTNPSFPSGHVFGSTVMFGFWGYLGIYYRLPRKVLAVFLVTLAAYMVAVGLSWVYLGAHWPSDVRRGICWAPSGFCC